MPRRRSSAVLDSCLGRRQCLVKPTCRGMSENLSALRREFGNRLRHETVVLTKQTRRHETDLTATHDFIDPETIFQRGVFRTATVRCASAGHLMARTAGHYGGVAQPVAARIKMWNGFCRVFSGKNTAFISRAGGLAGVFSTVVDPNQSSGARLTCFSKFRCCTRLTFRSIR